MRLCWMADVVGQVCFCFGFGLVGPDDVVLDVDIRNPLSLLVKFDSDGSLLIMMTLLFGEGRPRHALLSSCCLRRCTAWRTILFSASDFKKSSQNHGLRNA
jgi:hypothetical protein